MRATSRNARRRAPAGCPRNCARRFPSRAGASGWRPRIASARPARSDRRSARHSRDAPVPDRRIDRSRWPFRYPNDRTRPRHPGERKAPPFWNVQVRRHQEPRPAFEEHVLDLVRVAFDDFRHARVQRRFFGNGPNASANLAPDSLDVLFGVGSWSRRRQPLRAAGDGCRSRA